MVSSGHLGIIWRTWTLRMTSLSSPTAINIYRKNKAAKHSANTARTRHQQKQDKDHESQHKEQQPHHIERRATGRDRLVLVEDVKASLQQFMVLRTLWRAKQIKIIPKLRICNSNVKGVLLYGQRHGEANRRH